jgi:ribosomal protein S18 acetylase RimI-like enzyme
MLDPGSVTEPSIVIRPPDHPDHDQWAALFRAYRDFYRLPPDEAVVDRVWSWIGDPAHETNALVAVTGSGALVGLAHYRRFARPSTGSTGIYLDDLFTDTEHRGSGVGRALITAVTEIGAREGCSIVRWMTASDNRAAQRLYESVAVRTSWLTYDRLCRPTS